MGLRIANLLRVKPHITRKDLASHAQVSLNTVHSWITGRRFPHALSLRKIAEILDVSNDFLLDPNQGKTGDRSDASRESMKIYLQTAPFPTESHSLFRILADSRFAPTSVTGWRLFSREIIEPSLEYALQSHALVQSLLAEFAQREPATETPGRG